MPLPQTNMLAGETSPYLLQHESNPVNWRPWSADALAEASETGRPILLSVGYAACHWCHVMAHECFEDAGVAEVMNARFVNIKVDREERPDIDQIYMAALTAMGEQGGWPLTMFLTPEGKPFWGGTYFPREPRYGRPGFLQVLDAIDAAWAEKKADIAGSAETLDAHVRTRLSGLGAGGEIKPDHLPAMADAIAGMLDPEQGGLRGAPKFPQMPFMEVLWLNWLQNGAESHRDGVLHSLARMLNGGIYDHVGGGLCRYSTDARWIVPHFEKMLYDNAQLVRLASYAHAQTPQDLFRVRIEETIDWLMREMLVPGGGFASSLDADSEGEEGRFYLWTRDRIEAVLGKDDAAHFLETYTLESPPDWHGDPILSRRENPASGDNPDEKRLAEARQRLLVDRERRIRPGRDDKVLVDWNGMAISAIASAGRQFGREDWIDLARTAFRFVDESKSPDGRIPHAIRGPSARFPAFSSDHAAMIDAAIALFEATRDERYVATAKSYLEQLDRWHLDPQESGYFMTASDSDDVLMRVRGDVDEAVPSATSQTLRALLRLSTVTSDTALYQRCWRMAEAAMGRIREQPHGQAGIIHAAALVQQPVKLVIGGDARAEKLITVANRLPDPRRADIPGTSETSPSGVTRLSDGTEPPRDEPAAWLCIGQTCLPPITDPDVLDGELRGIRLNAAHGWS